MKNILQKIILAMAAVSLVTTASLPSVSAADTFAETVANTSAETVVNTSAETAANTIADTFAETSADTITATTPGSYIVPVTMKKATDLTADSAAKACLEPYGTLTIAEDGTETLTISMRTLSMYGLTDAAQQISIYNDNKALGEKTDVTVLETMEITGVDGNQKEVPSKIQFVVPEACKAQGGVYANMFIEAMNSYTNAYITWDSSQLMQENDARINYTSEGLSRVGQFGGYDVSANLTIIGGRITAVDLQQSNVTEGFEAVNKYYFDMAADGLQTQITGLFDTDTAKIENLDAVSGATYSSTAIKQAVLRALGTEMEVEELTDPPEAMDPGTYTVTVAEVTDHHEHSLVENIKNTATIVVKEDGSMRMYNTYISGSTREPLYVLKYYGYYKNSDNTDPDNLTMDNVVIHTETVDGYEVVTDVTYPMEILSNYYHSRISVYVPAMKNLNGTIAGIEFVNGLFDIDTTMSVYWDTLKKVSDSTADLYALSDTTADSGKDTTSSSKDTTKKTVTKPSKAVIKRIKRSGTKITVYWKKGTGKVKNEDRYILQYSTSKKFTKKTTKTVKVSAKKTSVAIRKLKKGKTYYVRMRAYDKSTKRYGSYSSVKKVKIKK